MFKFGGLSLQRLSTCHPELQLLFNEVIKDWDCTILEGYRNQADQEKAFNAGKSKLHYPHGKHNQVPSRAVDVAPYPVPIWEDTRRFYYFAGAVMAIARRLKSEGKMTFDLRYGGDWNMTDDVSKNRFNDLVHFELVEQK